MEKINLLQQTDADKAEELCGKTCIGLHFSYTCMLGP